MLKCQCRFDEYTGNVFQHVFLLLVGCSSTSHKNIVNDESTLIKFDDDFVVRGKVFGRQNMGW